MSTVYSQSSYRYRITARSVPVEDSGIITTYGITVECEGGYRLASIENISSDRCVVQALCARLCGGESAPEHLRDIITDWLNDDD